MSTASTAETLLVDQVPPDVDGAPAAETPSNSGGKVGRRTVADEATSLATLTDAEVHAGARRSVAACNAALARLLAHLGEVEARGIHRERACATLRAYCIYELRLSEDAADKRVRASRLTRQFPAALEKIAAGELHLTGLLMIGPYLTEQNQVELLARAQYRTKREIEKLVRRLDPLPPVPSRVVPLGPDPVPASPRAPSHAEQVAANVGPVRELPVGERPRDWGGAAGGGGDTDRTADGSATEGAAAKAADGGRVEEALRSAPERNDDVRDAGPTGTERYGVQFTAGAEYVALLQEARDLLSHEPPSHDLAEVHLRAMRVFVEGLRKRRIGSAEAATNGDTEPRPADVGPVTPPSAERGDAGTGSADPVRSGSRYIPVAVRRAVWARDEGRCAFVDAETGRRCRETALLEFHHEQPFGKGGGHSTDNVTLRCRAHNGLAAERDFGRERMLMLQVRGP